MSKPASPVPAAPLPQGLELSQEFKNFLKGKSPLSKINMNTWNVDSVPSTLSPLPPRQVIVTASPPLPATSLSTQQSGIPRIVIDSGTSSSTSSSDTESDDDDEDEDNADEKLDAVENAMNPLIQLYVDDFATSIVLCGSTLSEQALHVNELVKEYTVEDMEAGMDKVKNAYDIWLSTTLQCLKGMKDLKEINGKNLLTKVAAFSKQTTTTTSTVAILTKPKKKRKRKKSILETSHLPATKRTKYKYSKRPYTKDDKKYMQNFQVQCSPWLLAGEDDCGDYFDMSECVKHMAMELVRPVSGLKKHLRLCGFRLMDNKNGAASLIKKMKKAKIFPWPLKIQKEERARMLHVVLKHRKKQNRKT